MKKETVAALFIATGVVAIAIIIGVIRYVGGSRAVQKADIDVITQQLEAQQKQIEQNQLAIDVLVQASKSAQQQIAAETARRIAAENARQADLARSAAQIADLQRNIESNKTVDLSSIIQSWRPRIALVACRWNFSNGSVSGSGSGVLFPGGTTGAKIITNGHVVTYKGFLPSQCSVKFPDEPSAYVVAGSNITLATGGADAAFIQIPAPSQYLRSLATASGSRCVSSPSIGDSVVILGYPSIGSTSDITATEGITSGFDGDYFITSAKVERGNSGGAAILSKSNCYLGIPSFVDVGQIEALARILDQRVIGG